MRHWVGEGGFVFQGPPLANVRQAEPIFNRKSYVSFRRSGAGGNQKLPIARYAPAMTQVKQTPTIGRGKAGPGRKKGVPNRVNALLKDALLEAAAEAGGKGGLVAFLLAQACKPNNASFMTLLGKVLPTQLAADDGEIPSVLIFKTTYEDDARGIPPTPYIPPEYKRRD